MIPVIVDVKLVKDRVGEAKSAKEAIQRPDYTLYLVHFRFDVYDFLREDKHRQLEHDLCVLDAKDPVAAHQSHQVEIEEFVGDRCEAIVLIRVF